jgi:hypothetical protein
MYVILCPAVYLVLFSAGIFFLNFGNYLQVYLYKLRNIPKVMTL